MKIFPADHKKFPNYHAIAGVEVDMGLLKSSEAEALKPFGFTHPRTKEVFPCSGYALTTYDKDKVGMHKIQLDAEKHRWMYEELPKRIKTASV